jgi:hypothetical protein
VSATQTTSVMVFGALVAIAGIVLTFYAKSPGANRIRAFGVEFELSTPALVVFLAGCGLMLSPFLLERSIAVDATGDHVDADGEGEPTGGGNGTGEVDETEPLGTATETCGGGERFRLEILTSTEVDGIVRVPLRLVNLSEDERGQTVSGGLSVTDQDGRQLDLVDHEWSPPYLDPMAFYEGYMELRSDDHVRAVTVRYRPNPSCPMIAVRGDLPR